MTKINDQELRSAWTRIRRPGWPETFEACMAAPMIAGQVTTEACRKRNYKPPVLHLRPMPAIDFKRRAAGEKDDE